MGIAIPGDRPELRDRRNQAQDYRFDHFPEIAKLHMYALAQHYGIPTRLLDWTLRPLVAAYFAAKDIARIRSKLTGRRAVVWALYRPFVEAISGWDNYDPSVVVVTAPRASNPNLSAQGGLFTMVQPRKSDLHPLPSLDDVIRENVANIPSNWQDRGPFLFKVTIPVEECGRLLRMLALEDVHAASVFPHLSGVAMAISERKSYVLSQTDVKRMYDDIVRLRSPNGS